ncbi:MAG: hypothetical protein R3A48_18950 [Polyangiales bacterium]
MDPDEPAAEVTADAPRGLRALPVFTGFAAMLMAQVAQASLSTYRRVLDPPHDLNGVWAQAVIRAAQEHRRLAVGREVGALLVAVLLFISSARVVLRSPGAGWLWRQALVAQILLAGATVWVERSLEPARRRAFFEAAQAAQGAVQPLSGTRSLEETLRALLAFSAAVPAAWAAAVSLILLYASRPKVRAFIG